MMKTSNILLIGVGNQFRQDDGVGLFIVEQISDQIPTDTNIKTLKSSGNGVNLIEAWLGMDRVYLFDASFYQNQTGLIHRFEVHDQSLPKQFFRCSTHHFGVAEAVELAKILDQLPPQLIIYTIEGKNFTYGLGLCWEVEEGARKIVKQVLSELAKISPIY